MHLLHVTNSTFCAGAVFGSDTICLRAAPIIKWMVGQRLDACISRLRSDTQLYLEKL